MKNKNALTLILILMFGNLLHANPLEKILYHTTEENNMWYFSPSVVFFDTGHSRSTLDGISVWQLLGVGHRWYANDFATDLSLGLTAHPEGFIFSKLDLLCHYIPYQNLKSHWYVGAGAAVCSIWIIGYWTTPIIISGPELALGYKFQTSAGSPRFIQCQIGTPIWTSGGGFMWGREGSNIIFSYGFGF